MTPSMVQKVFCEGINSLFASPSSSMRTLRWALSGARIFLSTRIVQKAKGGVYSLPSKVMEHGRFHPPLFPFCPQSDLNTAQLTLSGSDPIPLHLPASIPTSSIHLLESFESSHSSRSTNATISSNLSITHLPIRMDSQAKYGVLARSKNGGGIYLRMPTGIGYREKIWVSETPGHFVACR